MLAYHYRCAAPAALFGLPEVNPGVIPGAGGSQRLPRLVGALRALEMILGAKAVLANRALAIGLIDRVPQGSFIEGAVAYAHELIATSARLVEPTSSPPIQQDSMDPDRRQLELPVVLPHLRSLPVLPHSNVTHSKLNILGFSVPYLSVIDSRVVCRRRRKKLLVRCAGMNTEHERSRHAHSPEFESPL